MKQYNKKNYIASSIYGRHSIFREIIEELDNVE